MSASLAALQRQRIESPNTIVKSGHLLISSKGLGWKSWKKRWFILTRTSLVFFKNDPNALPQRAGEVNSTLGGIDISNSGSVVVREDKKLLTVLFPDGRAFTLKAETSEDLYEWKTALERTLAEAQNAALVMRKNGIFPSDTGDSFEGSFRQLKGNCAVKSLVLGCPVLLALEDIDGGPSFLEKALQFLEKHGTKVEGILRQSADVEEVDRRIQEYEQGKTEFDPSEDAHVIGDCVKYVLRELPSSPVPASCCSALLEAYRVDWKDARISVMRSTIRETFPEPNRCLLQRVLKMMHIISSHASTNLMNPPAVAACMAPLLLRSLVAGECEFGDDYYVNGDNSAQLLAAANAASNARAIITTLLEEYGNIFNDDSLHRCSISVGSQIENGSEDTTDNENHDMKQNCFPDAEHEVEPKTHDYPDRTLSGNLSESSGSEASDLYDYKARRGPSMESVSASGEEELSVRRLELAKDDLRQRIAKEERGNAILQARLERKRQALNERRLALEQEVATLQEQLQAERDLRAALEVGLSMSAGQFPGSRGMDSKTRNELEDIALAEADVTRLKQKVAELHLQLNRQRLLHYGSLTDMCRQYQHAADHSLQEKYFRQTFDANLDSGNPAGKKGTEVLDHLGRPSSASSTLVELTTRLDFFKERRSQLMEQLNNLDLNYGGAMSQPSPAWN